LGRRWPGGSGEGTHHGAHPALHPETLQGTLRHSCHQASSRQRATTAAPHWPGVCRPGTHAHVWTTLVASSCKLALVRSRSGIVLTPATPAPQLLKRLLVQTTGVLPCGPHCSVHPDPVSHSLFPTFPGQTSTKIVFAACGFSPAPPLWHPVACVHLELYEKSPYAGPDLLSQPLALCPLKVTAAPALWRDAGHSWTSLHPDTCSSSVSPNICT
jgi:hypothetical protein